MSQSAVSITSACVVLRGQTVLEDAQLSVNLGTTVGIVGPNGSGKSTLLRLIVGLVHPDHGTVRVLGGSPSDVAVLRRLGAAIDTPALYPWMSGRTTLRTFLSLAGEADEGRSERALDRFDLAGAGRKPVARYSQGMRKRLALAVASVRNPELLILDEPTNGLDESGHRLVHDWLRERQADGQTTVMATHRKRDLELCDQTLRLEDGRLIEGTAEELDNDLETSS